MFDIISKNSIEIVILDEMKFVYRTENHIGKFVSSENLYWKEELIIQFISDTNTKAPLLLTVDSNVRWY